MRKIEQHMLHALAHGLDWHEANTSVTGLGTVKLHGNVIAYRLNDGELFADAVTFHRWPTRTTKSRLRALGLDYSNI
jgi:hypothetical protein